MIKDFSKVDGMMMTNSFCNNQSYDFFSTKIFFFFQIEASISNSK